MPVMKAQTLLYLHGRIGLTINRFKCLEPWLDLDISVVRQKTGAALQALKIDPRAIKNWQERSNFNLEKVEGDLQKHEISYLYLNSSNYPPLLREITDPPIILFYRGDIELLQHYNWLAVVGGRRMTKYGQQAIDHLIPEAVHSGINIVSGLAYGTDIAAHKACVGADGKTIAVMAHGLDSIYPKAHIAWAQEAIKNGQLLLLSEHLPGVEARPEFFPVRNRIVSGIARATLVIEAALKSGSLITAQQALEQNRDVLAVPGSIFSPLSAGTNQILQQGAQPVICPQEILDLYNINHQPNLLPIDETAHQHPLLQYLSSEPLAMDELIRQSGQSQSEVIGDLLVLEMQGIVKNTGNHEYIRIK